MYFLATFIYSFSREGTDEKAFIVFYFAVLTPEFPYIYIYFFFLDQE